MANFKKIMASLSAAVALFAFASCAQDDDNPFIPYVPVGMKTVYKASSKLSDYSQRVVNGLNYVSVAAAFVPDLYVISGSDLAGLGGNGLKNIFETSLKGGTVLVDAPTSAQMIDFKAKVDAYFATQEGVVLGQRVLAANDSFYDLLNQYAMAAGDTAQRALAAGGKQYNYEAVASRGRQIYFVHDIDEALEASATEAVIPGKKGPRVQTERCQDSNPSPALIPRPENPTDWKTVTNDSVSKFSSWVKGDGASLLAGRPADATKVSAASAIVNAGSRPAQTFVHNFSAAYKGNYEHYDGRYNGKTETVEVIIDVWAACQINDTVASSVDWYLVRTSVVCNNQQLGYKNEWDSAKHVGPYFNKCDLSSFIADSTVKTNECSPQNAAGSTSFTTGSSFSLSGNVGFNMSGPTGGVGVGYSESQSSTRSIPDIGVNWNGTQSHQASWNFTTPDVDAYWSGFYTKCDGAKDIQAQAAVFDTYTLYNLASDKAYAAGGDKVRLETYVKVGLLATVGWVERLLDLYWCSFGINYYITYNDYIQKPSNTFKEYIMSFKAPDGVTPEQADRLHSIVKEYISDWNSVERYYAVGTANLDTVAKNYFASAKKKISDNKAILQGRGFKGTFKFFINRVEGGGLVDSFDLTF